MLRRQPWYWLILLLGWRGGKWEDFPRVVGREMWGWFLCSWLWQRQGCSASPSFTPGMDSGFSPSPGWKWEWGKWMKLVSQTLVCLASKLSNQVVQPCVRIAIPGQARDLSPQYLSLRVVCHEHHGERIRTEWAYSNASSGCSPPYMSLFHELPKQFSI